MIAIQGRFSADVTFSPPSSLFAVKRDTRNVENTSTDRVASARNGDEFTEAVSRNFRYARGIPGMRRMRAYMRDPIVSISETTWERPCDARAGAHDPGRVHGRPLNILYQTTSVRRKRAVSG